MNILSKIIKKIQYIIGNYKYNKYFKSIYPSQIDLKNMQNDLDNLKLKPKISIIVPTYDTPEQLFIEMVESVKKQVYNNWELILVDDCSSNGGIRDLIEKHSQGDDRIKYKFLKENLHIAGATNEAFKLATGEFLGLFDHDDLLWPNALYEVVKAVNNNPSADFLYTDEDKIVNETGKHKDPFLKPDWNESLLLNINYITHFTVVKKTLLDEIQGEKTKYNGAQDWDFILRATHSSNCIVHIPKILYSWRIHSESTAGGLGVKPYVLEAQRLLLEDNFKNRNMELTKANIRPNPNFQGQWFNDSWEGEITKCFSLNNIKGLSMNSADIHRNLGRRSLTEHIYKSCQYEVQEEGKTKLFQPNDK